MIYPRFGEGTLWNFAAACELFNAHYPTAPLGLITVAALLPTAWTIRLVDRNTGVLADGDLEWADLVMTGGMLPQYFDTALTLLTAAALTLLSVSAGYAQYGGYYGKGKAPPPPPVATKGQSSFWWGDRPLCRSPSFWKSMQGPKGACVSLMGTFPDCLTARLQD